MATSLKVELVSRSLGNWRGESATLICDARLVNRAVDAIESISRTQNIMPDAIAADKESACEYTLHYMLDIMESPAYELLGDFRSEYTAPRDRIIRFSFDEGEKLLNIAVVPTLTRIDPVTVRVSGIEVRVLK